MVAPRMMFANAAALGALYVVLSPRVAKPLYRPILFHPDPYPSGNYNVDAIENVSRKEVFFDSLDGTKLHGWWFSSADASRTIIFSHGNAGNLTYRIGLVKLLLQAGASVFLYDYRGYGLSEGLPDVKGICADACAAYDYVVQQQGVAPETIVLYGESLGAAVACQVSTVRPSAGLIVQSGFCSLRRISSEVLPWMRLYPSWLFPQPNLDNLSLLKRSHPPLLILHGKRDTIVPFSHAEEVFQEASEPKRLVLLSTANHSDISIMEPVAYVEAIRDFLSSLPQSKST